MSKRGPAEWAIGGAAMAMLALILWGAGAKLSAFGEDGRACATATV